MSVSRALRLFGEPGRPADWFSQKSCALQYGNLLENVDTPKRKKRTDKSGSEHVETPGEAIVRNLTNGKNHCCHLSRFCENVKLYHALWCSSACGSVSVSNLKSLFCYPDGISQ
jgi:hypothetical protein